MAQRIRSCTNSTNFETINCESYLPRLLKRDQSKSGNSQKSLRDPSASNIRTGLGTGLVTPPILKSRPGVRQHNLQPSKPPSSPANVVHKQLLPENSSSIEVIVPPNRNRRPCTGDSNSINRQPWGQVLKSTKSSETLSSFSNFDPLRTLHFLAKELRSKLKTVAPSDPSLLQMVTDMEHALNRIPREISSSVRLKQELENLPLKEITSKILGMNENQIEQIEQIEYPVQKICRMSEKSSQTTGKAFPDTEMFHQQLEANADKLEAAYKAMEQLCNRLKTEKDEVELLLFAEKDTVKFLRKQIEELETEKAETRNTAFEKVAEERDNLQIQVKRLQARIEPQANSFSELKTIVKELQKENGRIKHENLTLRHKLTLFSMEKEKYVAILNVRDRQINEIRAEMNQLQDVITEQLTELQMSSVSNQNPAVGVYR